jgi:lysophospholipase L1-like esterase
MPDPSSYVTKFAVVGDSVAWGQGLLSAHKFSTKVAVALGQPLGNVSLEAHSGAIIGISLDQNGTSIDPEIPAPAPKISDQVNNFQSPEDIDVVIMCGGINDVDIKTIFNPLTPVATVQDRTLTYCYNDMLALIGSAVATFTKPTCRFLVLGYYPILSAQSRPFLNLAGTDALGQFLSIFASDFPLLFDRSIVVENLIQLAQQFYICSQANLARAVSDARVRYDPGFTIPLTNRMAFVANGFTDANALFASAPLLWGFQGPDMGPEDEVAPLRQVSCKLQYGEPWRFGSLAMCEHASVGHPNVAGAQVFADAIVSALNVMAEANITVPEFSLLTSTQ